jgi:HTH-type transcriptional regulator / antitoxin HigA
MQFKVIRTEDQYLSYLNEVRALISAAPAMGSAEADTLELLTVLIESYENKIYPVEAPDPIDAILFRMQEQGFKQADLIPYFGTRSRVSEVLGRKRPLTVQMIRALSVGLGMSADTLIGQNYSLANKSDVDADVDWGRFPVKEMMSRGWITKASSKAVSSIEDTVKEFLQQVGFDVGSVSFKRSLHGDAYSPTTKYALYVWLARVIQRARQKSTQLVQFDAAVLSQTFVRNLAQLSWSDNGPTLAVEFLEKHGIAVIIEPHLKGTLLDGAAFKDENGMPIIGLTLRFDRIDNFWFTLVHEVIHLWKHVNHGETFMDDLENSSEDKREVEANRITREAFIPRAIWKRSQAYTSPSVDAIDKLSRELKIHPAVIAGRLRRDQGNYQIFNDLLGHNQVRRLFTENFKGEVEL